MRYTHLETPAGVVRTGMWVGPLPDRGSVLEAPFWAEPVEVEHLEQVGCYVRVAGRTVRSRQAVSAFLTSEQWNQVQVRVARLCWDGDARRAFLALEARRYRLAATFDPLLAVSASRVHPLPHQIEAVYGYVLRLPRIRFLIADDPGAGKTIMAGLIVKELKLRGLARRILIVVPGHLRDQWIREMRDRFNETFFVVERATVDALYGENPWLREDQVITSMDFAKQEDILSGLSAAHWDLVIVDEAHKLSAYRYGDRVRKTERYQLGEVLSRNSVHLLFLTATPHRGDPENFRLLLDLLAPGFFATPEMVQRSLRDRDNPLFIRRMKEDLKDFEGRPLFVPRKVITHTFQLGVESPREKELYNALSEYVREQYNLALRRGGRRNVAFALVILQRRMASSTYALLRSLERRRQRLAELCAHAEALAERAAGVQLAPGIEEADDLPEAERWRLEEEWEVLSVAENRRELEREVAVLDRLIADARAIVERGEEYKLRELREALANLQREHPGEKVIVFTESRDTMEHLARNLRAWGYRVTTIHGGMSLEERVAAEGEFKDSAQVLVATEAAGEGINLQFCHLMVNYDLPWTPNRLEQRMGRIHRYGQRKEVFIYNLVAADTREGMVLAHLLLRLEEIRKALGDKVFDVIGDLFPGKRLAQLLQEAAAGARSMEEILRELDVRVDEDYVRRVREQLGESLATRFIDFSRIRELAERAREHRLAPEYTEEFFRRALEAAGGRMRRRQDGLWAIESVPYVVRDLGERVGPRGAVAREYPKVTFDKDVAEHVPDAELLSFGHPLFEAVLAWAEQAGAPDLERGAVLADRGGRYDGLLYVFEGEVRDGGGTVVGKRLFGAFTDGERVERVPMSRLWDLVPAATTVPPGPDPEACKDRVVAEVVGWLAEYLDEVVTERRRQAEVKRKYGLESLRYCIAELEGELIALYERREHGEPVDLPIRNKEERKRRYVEVARQLEEEIRREVALTMGDLAHVATLRVVPASVEDDMASDPEIERIGMEVTMRYEREQGRDPEDVSREGLGYDIRSREPGGGVRYIEVKARAREGAVELTPNEWLKAQRFRNEYYLYVVYHAATRPQLRIIQDPAAALQPAERIEVVRYVVPREQIVQQSEVAGS